MMSYSACFTFTPLNTKLSENTLLINLPHCISKEPVTVAKRSKARTVFARSEAGTAGSNPTQGMDV
jgi:hypothetical protein